MDVSNNVKEKFKSFFKEDPIVVHAPGRVNLIGEHTDYNNGFVMPASIDKGIAFAIAASAHNHSVIYSSRYQELFSFDQRKPEKTGSPSWANYLLGVLYRLTIKGYPIKAFNCVFDGDLPSGAGLSSSAAMECGFVFAVNELFGFNLPPLEMIETARWSEHHYVGVKCGIMDQFASIMGKQDHVVMLDCQSLEHHYYPLDLKECCLLLCNTNVNHSLAASEYNIRRAECERGVALLKEKYPHINSLRDVSHEQLEACTQDIPEKIYNRCLYVIEENVRVLDARRDLENGNLKAFGEKMHQTHNGLSKHYEVSCPELDFLVHFTKKYDGIYGARMMGGGFGGCTINIIRKDGINDFIAEVSTAYKNEFNRVLTPYVVNTSNGTSIIEKPQTVNL